MDMVILKRMSHRIETLSLAESIVIYFLLLATFAVIWLTRGTAAGSLSGGILCGLLLNTGIFLRFKNEALKAITFMLGVVVMGALNEWKADVLMPPNWEPVKHFQSYGAAGVLLGLMIAVAFEVLRSPKAGSVSVAAPIPTPVESSMIEEKIGVERNMPRWQITTLAVCLIANIMLMLSYARPDWIGTPRIAVAQYIYSAAYDYKHKDGLAYLLASSTEVTIESIEQTAESATAVLRATMPVAPYEVSPDSINTEVARRTYLKLDAKDRPYVTITGRVSFVPSAVVGWRVTESTFNVDPVRLSNDYRAGLLKADSDETKHPFLLNMFGMHEMIIRPFNIFAIATLLLSFMLFMDCRPWVAMSGIGISTMICAAPIVMSYITMSAN